MEPSLFLTEMDPRRSHLRDDDVVLQYYLQRHSGFSSCSVLKLHVLEFFRFTYTCSVQVPNDEH